MEWKSPLEAAVPASEALEDELEPEEPPFFALDAFVKELMDGRVSPDFDGFEDKLPPMDF